MCAYQFAPAYSAQCAVPSAKGGNCDVDVDECHSKPCQNGGVCHQYVDAWACDCFEVVNNRTGKRKAYNGTFCETEIDVCSNSEDDCDPLHAACQHIGPGQHGCKCHVGWSGDGKTCRDIDECASKPCKNGAKCSESSCSPSSFPKGTVCDPKSKGLPPVDAYSCACVAGFANGVCAAGWDKKSDAFTRQYAKDCNVSVGGHCDIDMDECVSAPCQNGAGCTDSRDKTWDGKAITADAFSCACVAGFTRGTCAYKFIAQYTAQCSVVQGGTCDVVVNECSSSPCVNGATCTESTSDSSIPVGQYSCSCVAGFTNGVCKYAY
ncbi:MAG: hypothetical protein VXX04_06605, partial [Actinomycetota bacterium]|nr:hypothetical protein [Actinomycetota bacterium]